MRLSPLVSRTLALSLAVFVAMAVVSLVFAPLWTYYQEQWFQANLLGRQMGRFQAVLAHEQELSVELDIVGNKLGSENLLVQGESAAIASANLREFVSRAIEGAGAQLVSVQDIDGQPLSSLVAIGLRVQVTGEIDHFVTLLNQLEYSEPYIIVASMDVNSTMARLPAHLQVGQDLGNSLSMTLDLIAYGKGDAP
jgi:hypothetical protein